MEIRLDQQAVRIQGVSKVFRPPLPWLRRALRRPQKKGVVALREITFEIEQGEIFGLVGRNGQGKTTLIKTIAGLVEATTGTVRVFGLDPIRDSQKVRQRIGLVTSDERSFYWRLTGMQNLLFFSRLHGFPSRDAVKKIQSLVEAFDLGGLVHRRFNEFSTGNKQRLSIVRALLTDPQLLLLDEPTRSLDPISADALRRLLVDWVKSEPGRTVLITTHNLEEVEELCGRVGILSHNSLVECATLSELRQKYASADQITLKAKNISDESSLTNLQSRLGDMTWRKTAPHSYEISFASRNGDSALNVALTGLLESGAEVESCDTERHGLHRIMVEIEREGNPTP
jgi:ABC-2 type transport system ATP-binding protein